MAAQVKEYFVKYDKMGTRRLSVETFRMMMRSSFPRSAHVLFLEELQA